MADPRLITSARIKPSSRNMFASDAELKAKVFVRFDGAEEEELLFSFFDDELSFRASEFVGKTREQGHDLFRKKDTRYFRS